MPVDEPTFGEYLRRRRKALGLSQQDVADRFGVNQSSAAKWENGILMPHRRHFGALARFLEMDVSEVVRLLTPSSTESTTGAEGGGRHSGGHTVPVRDELFDALQALADAQGTTLAEQVERAIVVFLRSLS